MAGWPPIGVGRSAWADQCGPIGVGRVRPAPGVN